MTWLEKTMNYVGNLFDDDPQKPANKTRPINIPRDPSQVSVRAQLPASFIPQEQFEELFGVNTPEGRIGGRATPGLERQREGLDDLESQYSSLRQYVERMPDQMDLTNLMNVSDSLWGTNYLKGYKAPMNKIEKMKTLANMEELLQKSRGDLTKSEIAFIKANYPPMMGFSGSVGESSKGKGGGKTLPASEGAKIADMKSQLGKINNLMSLWHQYPKASSEGTGGWLWDKLQANFNPFSDQYSYGQAAHQAATTIGKSIEGRMTDADYNRYYSRFIPIPGDSEEVAQQKIQNLKNYIQEKITARQQTFAELGYNVQGMSKPAPAPAPSRKSIEGAAGKVKPKTNEKNQRRKLPPGLLKKKQQLETKMGGPA
jgi:hypothetical protein